MDFEEKTIPDLRLPPELAARLGQLSPERVSVWRHPARGIEPSHFPSPVVLETPPREEAPAKRRGYAKFVGLGLTLVAIAGATAAYLRGRGRETTDDAQIEGHVYDVQSRVAGRVTRVLVRDNQVVEADQPLVELDRTQLETRLAIAHAEVAAARAGLQSAEASAALTEQNAAAMLRQARGGVRQAHGGIRVSRSSIVQARADIAAAQSRHEQAERDYARVTQLRADGAATDAETEARQAQVEQAAAALALAQARYETATNTIASSVGMFEAAQGRLVAAETAPRQVDVARAAVAIARARVEQALAAERLVELDLSYTTVRAPARGIVSRRAVEPGLSVSPDRPLLAIAPVDDVWLVANFKENQVGRMRPGQRVDLEVDTYAGQRLTGRVESLSGASGSRFALLPPDNSSGNFVKVSQRIPVLIRFERHAGLLLRPGMSATATVFTGE